MDVHGRYVVTPGGREREGKSRPPRTEDPRLKTSKAEDAEVDIALAIHSGDTSRANRVVSALKVLSSLIESEITGNPTRRAHEYDGLTLRQLAQFAAHGGRQPGCSRLGAYFQPTQHQRDRIDDR